MSTRILLAIRIPIDITNNIDDWIRTDTSIIDAEEDIVAAVDIARGNTIERIKAIW